MPILDKDQFNSSSFFDDIGAVHPRSKSVRGNRSDMLEEIDEGALSETHGSSSITAEGVKFNRKRDRMAFKQDSSKSSVQR